MRWYSQKQVLLFSFLGVLLGIMAAAGIGLVGYRIGSSAGGDPEPASVESAPQSVPAAENPETGYTGDFRPALLSERRDYYADETENIDIYNSRNSGVVNITTETLSYNWFLEPVPGEGTTGSGSIIDERGYVLTNNHVVADAYRVFITLADGEQVQGEVIGTDPENDLAVVKFDPAGRNLNVIPMGSSSNLKVGQRALAIGNPFALDRTLTVGIISGLGRPIRARGSLVIRDMIQTDASINPGNSGGPLLDSRGEIIGINTAIYSQSGGSIGIGFAVPVDTAKRVVPDLISYGYVRRGWIDIVPIQLFPQLVRYADLPVDEGLLVNRVIDGGMADRAGIRGGSQRNTVRYGNTLIRLGGDIIIEVAGVRIGSLANLYEALEDTSPGDTVEVVLIRGNREISVQVELTDRPEEFLWS